MPSACLAEAERRRRAHAGGGVAQPVEYQRVAQHQPAVRGLVHHGGRAVNHLLLDELNNVREPSQQALAFEVGRVFRPAVAFNMRV
jgi:hypothetical protein